MKNQNVNIADITEQKNEKSIGQIIREERIRKNIQLIDASSKTKLKVAYLEAIENNDFDKLPAPIYAKNFIRIYANFLGLDGVELAKMYNISTIGISKLPPASGKITSTYYISTFLHFWLRHPFIFLGIVVVIAIFLLYPTDSDENNLNNSVDYSNTAGTSTSLNDYQPVFDINEPLPGN